MQGLRAPIEGAQAPSSGECRTQKTDARRFSPRLRNGIAVALVKTRAHFHSPTMPLLTTVRRALYALLAVRFIELQKKRTTPR
jgi:hypothetical protein